MRNATTTALAALVLTTGCSPAPENAQQISIGDYPDDYIRSENYTRLLFEVDAIAGYAPRIEAQDYVIERLDEVIDKPDGISFVTDGEIESNGSDHVWTYDELNQLGKRTIDMEVPDDTVKIHVLYLDGSYESDGGATLGVAWKNRHLAIFADAVNESCDRPLIRDRLCRVAESSILLHEVGHVIGLVDNGVPMVEDHKDADRGAHDVSDECVMYWAYEGTRLVDLLADRLAGDSPELEFDDACKADLAAVRDR